ncbi:MAG: DUF5615 family PIN-like protein [Acidobacteria bacterium]|nr:DUF5615 family PIN-like protein [Acidobacteriota bacterium]
MKFLIDRCAGRRLADWLRQQGHDIVEARSEGSDPGDRNILRRAVAEDRVLVTIDTDFGEFVFVDREPHRGLIRLPDVPAGRRILLMRRILETYTPEVIAGSVITVRGERIRVSKTHV